VTTKIHPAKQPGECMSVDSLESNTAGFVAQIKRHTSMARRHHISPVAKCTPTGRWSKNQ